MSEPRYVGGWMSEEEFRELNLGLDVTYRSVMRRTDSCVWVAPLGTPDPWPVDEADLWISMDGKSS